MAYKVRKPEHTGAKNSGGFWGTRHDAKSEGKRVRRLQEKAMMHRLLDEDSPDRRSDGREREEGSSDV